MAHEGPGLSLNPEFYCLCVYILFPVCVPGVTGGSFTQQPPPRKLGRWRRQRRPRSSPSPLPLPGLAPVPPSLPFNLFLPSVSPLQFSEGYRFNIIITTSSHFWALIGRTKDSSKGCRQGTAGVCPMTYKTTSTRGDTGFSKKEKEEN